jgi:hypothetical protein
MVLKMSDDLINRATSQLAARLTRNNGYLARQEISSLLENLKADKRRLEPFGFKVYSQADEDGVIETIMDRLQLGAGVFCEIGVENGLECNSLYLIHKGWKGVWVEGGARHVNFISEKFGSLMPGKLEVAHQMVTADNINTIMNSSRILGDGIDFLSIDIDGNDIYLLDALASRPKVICIEYNAKFPAHLSKRQTYDPNRHWQGTDYMGSSLKSITEVAGAKGYQLVGTNLVGSNAFFVRRDLAADLFCEDCSPEYLYNPPRYWLIFDHYSQIGHRADFGPYADLL